MELKKFITSLDSPDFFANKKVICFKAKQEYPLLFFALVIKKIKEHDMVEIIDANEQELSQIISRLETSFLGSKIVYWFRNISDLAKKKKEQLLRYFSTYTGPNNIVFFAIYEDIHKTFSTWSEVLLPDQVESSMYGFILNDLCGVKESSQLLLPSLIKKHKQLPIDMLCLLAKYAAVLGKNIPVFVEKCIDQLIVPQTSLFILSKHFFAKNPRLFFPYWADIQSLYAPQFWIVFWSEQLWRASGFIMFSRKKQYTEAKQISFRLPFTFLQKDWREYSMRELKKAHEFIYATDYNIKHGGSELAFDLFFSKFFTNQF